MLFDLWSRRLEADGYDEALPVGDAAMKAVRTDGFARVAERVLASDRADVIARRQEMLDSLAEALFETVQEPTEAFGVRNRRAPAGEVVRRGDRLKAEILAMCSEHFRLPEMQAGWLYEIQARNARVGVWTGRWFRIRRVKFGDVFLDREMHVDANGTARPVRKLCEAPPTVFDVEMIAWLEEKLAELEFEEAEGQVRR